jgi:hypothetical protein
LYDWIIASLRELGKSLAEENPPALVGAASAGNIDRILPFVVHAE